MIGTILENNDVWTYLSPRKISQLEKGTITGDYINAREEILGILTLHLKGNFQEMSDIGEYKLDKSENNTIRNLEVTIWKGKYEDLKERNVCLHLGHAHINLINTSKLDFHSRSLYIDLLLKKKRLLKSTIKNNLF